MGFLSKFGDWVTPLRRPRHRAVDSPAKSPLQRSKPLHLAERFHLSEQGDAGDLLFQELRGYLQDHLGPWRHPESQRVLWETGRVGGSRPYFFLQPLNHTGWLFERAGAGWVISRADKIQASDLFMRSQDSWDVVSIYEDEGGEFRPRVSTPRLDRDLMSFSVYCESMMEQIKQEATEVL